MKNLTIWADDSVPNVLCHPLHELVIATVEAVRGKMVGGIAKEIVPDKYIVESGMDCARVSIRCYWRPRVYVSALLEEMVYLARLFKQVLRRRLRYAAVAVGEVVPVDANTLYFCVDIYPDSERNFGDNIQTLMDCFRELKNC